jgi:hypothetical protein
MKMKNKKLSEPQKYVYSLDGLVECNDLYSSSPKRIKLKDILAAVPKDKDINDMYLSFEFDFGYYEGDEEVRVSIEERKCK